MYVIGQNELRELRKAGFYYDSSFGCFIIYKSAGISLLTYHAKPDGRITDGQIIVEPVDAKKLEDLVKRYEKRGDR